MRHHDFTIRIDRDEPLSPIEIMAVEDVIAFALLENFGWENAVDHRMDFTAIDRVDTTPRLTDTLTTPTVFDED